MNPDGSVDNSGLSDNEKYDITDDANYAGDKSPGDDGYLYMEDMYFNEGGLVEGRGSTEDNPIYNSNDTMQGGRSTMRGSTPSTDFSGLDDSPEVTGGWKPPVRARDRPRGGGSNPIAPPPEGHRYSYQR
jgi:hypothetical protein